MTRFPADVVEKARAQMEREDRARARKAQTPMGVGGENGQKTSADSPQAGKVPTTATSRVSPILTEAVKSKRQPTKTEQQAKAMFEATGRFWEVRWNAITLRLNNGLKYTPDLVCIPRESMNEPVTLVEVKNAAYQHASYGRSCMAYAQAKLDWPQFAWAWAEKQKDKSWKVTA